MTEESKTVIHPSARNKQRVLWKEVNDMSEAELREKLIQQYTDLQRIKAAVDKEKEIDYQLRAVKAKLEAFGVVTEDLDIH